MNTKINPIDIDERIYLTKLVEVLAFGSVIAWGHTGKYNDDGPSLESNDPGAVS